MKLITPALVIATAMAAYAPIANAGSAALVLNRTTLTNVNDAAGLWQHEGGNVFKSGVKIGQYALQRRVTTGGTTAPLNTAATTITLFLATAAGSAPQNIVLQGAHDFGPGNFRGAVSAASNRFSWIHGADATYSSPAAGTISLVMSWTGASQLTLP